MGEAALQNPGDSPPDAPPSRDAGPRYVGWRVSREEYLDLPEDGWRYDMIEGVLQLSPSPDADHSRAHSNFHLALASLLRSRRLGNVYIELDVLLPDGGDVLRPDLSFVRSERVPEIVRRHIHGAPDLVVEILSNSTAARDRSAKADRYLAGGVREYWLVDPRDRSVQLWIAGEENDRMFWSKREARKPAEILESRALPGLRIAPSDVFDAD